MAAGTLMWALFRLREFMPGRGWLAGLIFLMGLAGPLVGAEDPDPGQAKAGALTVDCWPGLAEVMVNGRPAGRTPLSLNPIDEGTYQVLLTREGYQPWRSIVKVRPAQTARILTALVPLPNAWLAHRGILNQGVLASIGYAWNYFGRSSCLSLDATWGILGSFGIGCTYGQVVVDGYGERRTVFAVGPVIGIPLPGSVVLLLTGRIGLGTDLAVGLGFRPVMAQIGIMQEPGFGMGAFYIRAGLNL